MMLDRTMTATRMGLLDQVRRPLLLTMLAVVPIIFISWGAQATAETPRTLTLPDGTVIDTDMRELMTVIDVPIAVAFLAGLVGVFVVTAALQSDRRLVVAGYTPGETVTPRLLVLTIAVLAVSLVSLVVMAFSYTPSLWGGFIAGTVLVGLQYGAIGALAGALMGRLGAVYFIFFLPNVDIGIAQNPMFFSGDPQGWAKGFPGYGGTRMIVEAYYAGEYHAVGALLPALAWLVGLGIAVVLLLRHVVAPRH